MRIPAVLLALLPLVPGCGGLAQPDAARAASEGKPQPASARALDAGRWAVLVGIDKYQHIKPDLEYAGADVRALGERLIEAGFGRQRVVVLHDQAAANLYPTKANIERQLRLTLQAAGPNDFVLVAFSGHGVRLEGRNYLCPADAQMDPAQLIPVDAIYRLLQNSQAKFKLLLVDACQDDNPPKEIVPTRAAGDIKAVHFGPYEKLPQGILLFTSCSPGQKAVEEPEFGHGVFTHFLLEGMTGQADQDQSGSISLLEWAAYASRRTRAYVRSPDRAQNPMMKGKFPDFELVMLPSRPPVRQEPFFPDRLPRQITNSIGMKLVLIPPGEFLMGSPESDDDAYGDEKPQHRVRITRPFYLGVTEVTQEQYEQVMGRNPSWFKFVPKQPVENVSWEDAVEFCRRLSQKEGKEYRLPSEAEWEYACRAGRTTRWCFGDDESLEDNAWYEDDEESTLEDYAWYEDNAGGMTHPVGQKKPNAWGLYDMHGNVWEWCADWYDAEYYRNSPVDDPPGPSSGAFRVIRGGAWKYGAAASRAASRYHSGPAYRGIILGFRVCRAAE